MGYQQIETNMRVKSSEAYKSYSYDSKKGSTEWYAGRGFVYRSQAFTEDNVGQLGVTQWTEIDTRALEYLDKIVNLCQENGSKVIFIATPLSYATMAQVKDYQEIVDFYNQLAQQYQVDLFDFSLSKDTLIPYSNTNFYDYIHLSGPGAEQFSTAAAKLLKDYLAGEEIAYDNLFYSSWAELSADRDFVYSAWIKKTKEGYQAYSTQGSTVEPVYQFSYQDGENTVILQPYSSNSILKLDAVPEGVKTIRVDVKKDGGSEMEQYATLTISK